jgi:hypothetical protein
MKDKIIRERKGMTINAQVNGKNTGKSIVLGKK